MVILVKDKKVITITKTIQKVLNEPVYKGNEWVDKGSEL